MYLQAKIKDQRPSCLQCVCVCQMEVRVEDCLLRGDASDLAYVLRHEGLSSITLTRLDQLVTKVTGSRPVCLLLFVCLFVCLFVSGAEWT